MTSSHRHISTSSLCVTASNRSHTHTHTQKRIRPISLSSHHPKHNKIRTPLSLSLVACPCRMSSALPSRHATAALPTATARRDGDPGDTRHAQYHTPQSMSRLLQTCIRHRSIVRNKGHADMLSQLTSITQVVSAGLGSRGQPHCRTRGSWAPWRALARSAAASPSAEGPPAPRRPAGPHELRGARNT